MTPAVELRFPDPHPQQSVSNCSPSSRTISPLEPDVPDIQRFWQPARWESHHRINENIREEKSGGGCCIFHCQYLHFPTLNCSEISVGVVIIALLRQRRFS